MMMLVDKLINIIFFTEDGVMKKGWFKDTDRKWF